MRYNTITDIKDEFIRKYNENDFIINPDGSKMLEIINADFVVDPKEEAIFGQLNDYAERELEWYNSQNLSVDAIPGNCPKIWKQICTKDDKHEVNSNYGYLVYSEDNCYQFKHAIQELIANPTSRRACHIYTRPSIWYDYNRNGMSDYICTFAVQLFIRYNTLHYCVNMRSNDVVLGFKNDLYWAKHVAQNVITQLHAAGIMVEDDPIIYWHANSLHMYERNFHYLTENN